MKFKLTFKPKDSVIDAITQVIQNSGPSFQNIPNGAEAELAASQIFGTIYQFAQYKMEI